MADQKTRTDLKLLFSAGKIPTESNFADLIESGINQKDDGLKKANDTPLKIQAPVTVEANANAPKDLILFYDKFDDAAAKWKIGSRSGGLEISRGAESDFLINSNGSVGIGTAEPKGKLQIINKNQDANGDTLILGLETQPNLRLGYDAKYTWIQSHQSKPLAINPLGNNVGIGTDDPLGTLSIGDSSVENSDGSIVVGRKKDNGSRHFKIGYDAAWNFVIGDYGSKNEAGKWTSQFAIDYRAPDNSFYIDNLGNIGIGTQKPAQKLHVAGNLQIDGELTATSSIFAQANVGIGTTTPGFPLTFANELGDKISLWGQVGDGKSYGFGIDTGLLQIYTDTPDADVVFGYGSSKSFTETMRVKGKGNVGIGTKKPLGPLSVGDSSVNGSDGFLVLGKKTGESSRQLKIGYDDKWNFVIGDYGNDNIEGVWSSQFAIHHLTPANSFYIDSAGNVGIGKNDPGTKLDVAGSITLSGDINMSNAASIKSAGRMHIAGEEILYLLNKSGVIISKEWGGNGNLSVQGNSAFDGSVGIGTHDPTAKLEVKGRIKDQTGFVMPVGSIVAFGGDSAPAGWLLCDGQPIPGDDVFSELRAILGQTTTPDLRGRTLISAGNGHLLKQTGGTEKHTLVVAEMPSHNHHGFGEHSAWDFGTVGEENHLGSAGGMDRDNYYFNTSSTGDNKPHENMQPYYVVNYMIKY